MISGENGGLQCADLRIDAGQRRVWRGSEEIELPKLSFDLLLALVRAAPNSLSIDELMDQVWNGTIVSSATVAKRVELLRHAIGDKSNDSQYIALVRGHGYRLIPPVSDPDRPAVPVKRRWRLALLFIALIAVAWFGLTPGRPPPEKSVAVLPFASMSSAEEDVHFADGLTEELSHSLARMGDLKVTGRTSSFYYKGRNEDLRTIGKALGVAHLLEGSVRRDGDTVRVTAQLINAEDGFHLWSESYDRPMTDLLQIQQEIARSVAGRLRSSIAPEHGAGRAPASTSPEAYALYLEAVSLTPYPWGPEMPRAQGLLERAVELDPQFAAAWNLLAAVHGRRMFSRDPTYELSPEDGMRVMHDAIAKARSINPDLGEIYASLGGIAWVFENDPVKAAPLIERAVELDPWNLNVIAFAANFATYTGRYDEALALEELLIARDPLCDNCRLQLSRSYSYLHRFEEAERELRTLRAVHGRGYDWILGVTKLHQHRPDEALQYFELIEDAPALRQLGRAMVLHDSGEIHESAELLAGVSAKWARDIPLQTAQAYAYTGDLDNAILWLHAAVKADPSLLTLNFPSPLFDNLRDDPRWLELAASLGIAPEQLAQVSFRLDTVLQQSFD